MAKRKSKSKAPTEIDLHVARRLREYRIQKGISQQALAKALGVSFQQVQKYEKGTNRISASRLQTALSFLGISPADVYAGLPEAGGLAEGAAPPYVADDGEASTRESSDLVSAFRLIGNPTVRAHLLALVKAIADSPLPPRRTRGVR